MRQEVISSIRPSFPGLSQSQGQVTHVLLTRSPLIHPASWASSFDLHVLSTPPAFILSQDQTLRKKTKSTREPSPPAENQQQQPPSSSRQPPPPTRGCKEVMATKYSHTWHQQTWHTIEFSNNRRFRPFTLSISTALPSGATFLT